MPERLARWQNPDGGWGARPGGRSRTEATAVAFLALIATSGPEESRAAALDWLASRQRPEGWWPAGDDLPEPHAATALAALALYHGAGESAGPQRAAAWLLDTRGRTPPGYVRLIRRLLGRESVFGHDEWLIGWPWVAENSSWVEPTAYALMALKQLGVGQAGSRWRRRVGEGEALLLDRVCRDGGWNYGNPAVFEQELPAMPDTTAWALLALRDRSEDPKVRAGLDRLRELTDPPVSALSAALAKLCFQAFGLPHLREVGVLSLLDGAPLSPDTRTLALGLIADAERVELLSAGAGTVVAPGVTG